MSCEGNYVSPVEREGIEEEGEVREGGGRTGEGSFERMMEPFDQDKEEEKDEEKVEKEMWEAAFGQGSSEGIRAKVVRSGYAPTPKEVEEHLVNHLPFRAWCRHCVKGKAKGMPHRIKKDKEEEQAPLVSIDYMFMEDKQKEG